MCRKLDTQNASQVGISGRDNTPKSVRERILRNTARPGDALERQADLLAGRTMRVPTRQRAASSVGASVAQSDESLPASARAFFEPRFGHDFSRVRVHADDAAAESARMLHAEAYTVGEDIYFGAHRYALDTSEGRQLMAHELAHTIQQRHGGSTSRSVDQVVARKAIAPSIGTENPVVTIVQDKGINSVIVLVDGVPVARLIASGPKHVMTVTWSVDPRANMVDLHIKVSTGVKVDLAPDALTYANITYNITPAETTTQPVPLDGAQGLQIIGPIPVADVELEHPAEAPFQRPLEDISTLTEGDLAAEPKQEGIDYGQVAEEVTDVVTDLVPGVSNVKDALIAISGTNPVTGEEVGVLGRVMSGVFAIPGLGNVLNYFGKAGKYIYKGRKYIAKGAKAVGEGLIWVGRKLGKPLIAAGEWTARKAKAIWNSVIERLGRKSEVSTVEPVSSKLSQPGGLSATEGRTILTNNGKVKWTHSLSEHGPDVTDEAMQKRLTDSDLYDITKFNDRATMEKVIGDVIDQNLEAIEDWASKAGRGALKNWTGWPGLGNLGEGYTRKGSNTIKKITHSLETVRVRLLADGNGGYLIESAFPR